jgi:hypothetical protein
MFRVSRAISIFLLFQTLGLCDFGAFAQSVNPIPKAPSVKHDTKTNRDDDQEVTLPEDMRIKMAITREENEYKKVLEDVDKLSGLSDEVARVFVERKHLSPDEMKKLGTIEKLAKRILSHAGGEEVGDKSDSQHLALAEAIDKLNAAACNIKKDMNAETRFVVSATVIANSNEVIILARLIKHIQKAD